MNSWNAVFSCRKRCFHCLVVSFFFSLKDDSNLSRAVCVHLNASKPAETDKTRHAAEKKVTQLVLLAAFIERVGKKRCYNPTVPTTAVGSVKIWQLLNGSLVFLLCFITGSNLLLQNPVTPLLLLPVVQVLHCCLSYHVST